MPAASLASGEEPAGAGEDLARGEEAGGEEAALLLPAPRHRQTQTHRHTHACRRAVQVCITRQRQ
eukprot:51064-Rhodomonas_salina.1